jgi:hypothetical protein
VTPEERWLKIENNLAALTAHQVSFQIQIAKLEVRTEKNAAQIDRNAAQIEKNAWQTEKNTDAIRDLIKISSALIEAQQRADAKFTEKLQALLDTVSATLLGMVKKKT